MRTPLLMALTACSLVTTSSAFQLKQGDVYEWISWNLTSYEESRIRLAVLDSVPATGNVADSGFVWRVLLQSDSRPGDTLKLLVFKDGAMRWLGGSSLLPIELEPPGFAIPIRRGGIDWGAINCRGCLEVTAIRPTGDGAEVESRRIGFPQSAPTQWTYVSSLDRIHGVWTDSVGPIWFRTEQVNEFFLQSKNGREVVWESPRLDTLHRLADSLARARDQRRSLLRIPRIGDRYEWRLTEGRTLLPPERSDPSYSRTILVTAVVSAAPADSLGWIRRTFQLVQDSSVRITGYGVFPDSSHSARSDTILVHHRWDPKGSVRSDVPTVFSDSWSVLAEDSLLSDGSFVRGASTFRATGELLSFRWDEWRDFAGMCRTCIDSRSEQTTLLAAPGYTAGVAGTSRRTPGVRKPRLPEVALRDPQAMVSWSTLDGRRGSQAASAFVSTRRTGLFLVQVRTSEGAVFEEVYLGK